MTAVMISCFFKVFPLSGRSVKNCLKTHFDVTHQSMQSIVEEVSRNQGSDLPHHHRCDKFLWPHQDGSAVEEQACIVKLQGI
jgi:hypothetical protein